MKGDLGQVGILWKRPLRLRVVEWLVQGHRAIQDKCVHAPFLGEIIQTTKIKMLAFPSSPNATLPKELLLNLVGILPEL